MRMRRPANPLANRRLPLWVAFMLPVMAGLLTWFLLDNFYLKAQEDPVYTFRDVRSVDGLTFSTDDVTVEERGQHTVRTVFGAMNGRELVVIVHEGYSDAWDDGRASDGVSEITELANRVKQDHPGLTFMLEPDNVRILCSVEDACEDCLDGLQATLNR